MAKKYIRDATCSFKVGIFMNSSGNNPRSDLQASDIHQVSNFIKNNNLLLGDKYGADSAGILTADIVESTKVTLDL